VPHWVGRKYRIANRITNDTTTIRGTLRSVIELVQKEKAPRFELSGPTPSESRVESKRVDQFENMSDEELRQYVYGTKELDA
jgi:hypothetical protein